MNEFIDTAQETCRHHKLIQAQILEKLVTMLPELSERSLKVFLACLKHLNAERLDFKMSVATLVAVTGLSQATVYRGLENLVEIGFITQNGIKRELGPIFLTSLRTEHKVVVFNNLSKTNQPTMSKPVLLSAEREKPEPKALIAARNAIAPVEEACEPVPLSPALEAASKRKDTTELDIRRMISRFGIEVVETASQEMLRQYPTDEKIQRSFACLLFRACEKSWKAPESIAEARKTLALAQKESSRPSPGANVAVHKQTGERLTIQSIKSDAVEVTIKRLNREETMVIPSYDWSLFEFITEQQQVADQVESGPTADTSLAVHKESGTQLRVVSVEPHMVRAVVSRFNREETVVIPNWDWPNFQFLASA